jgi:ribose 1,5-bisphosphokinase PhnN
VNVKVIVISGSMGSGKTTVLGEASDILSEREFVHAILDLDAIGTVLLPDDSSRDLSIRNLQAVFTNFTTAGITRVLLAAAVESREHLQALRGAMSEPELVVCRLTAAVETMERRLRVREPGMHQEQFVTRSRELDARLEVAHVEDFTALNDGRSVTDVATEVLHRAGWIA